MTDTTDTTRIARLKDQAKRLRAKLSDQGTALTHSQALELLAQQHGVRDWNTLRALAVRPGNVRPLVVGDRVSGQYLGQPFDGYVHGLQRVGQSGHYRITLQFDTPIDVVTFDSFSSFRQRVSGTIGEGGRSVQKTSDGKPQLVVERAGL